MVNKEYLGRGIHSPKFLSSLKNGKLNGMLEVVNADENLDIQIREDYLNIYYRGGNIAKVNSEKSIGFDKFYFYLGTDKVPKNEAKKDSNLCLSLKKKRDKLIECFKEGDYETFFSEAKGIMDKWFEKNPKPERDTQHYLSLNNRNGQSCYDIIDIEYQVSTQSSFKCTYKGKRPRKDKRPPEEKHPRFDIIAVNREGVICVIELKKGTKALYGTSGLEEHWACYKNSIKRNPKDFIEEMKKVLEQKQELGLIDKHVQINPNEEPIFVFAYAYAGKDYEAEKDTFIKVYEQIEEEDRQHILTITVDNDCKLVNE